MTDILGFILMLFTISAFAQNIGDRPVYFNEHPQHADVRATASEGSAYAAQGERTSNFPSPADQVPLGTVTRQYRAEHKNAPKSVLCWEGDGHP
jgi:hypothetical protein